MSEKDFLVSDENSDEIPVESFEKWKLTKEGKHVIDNCKDQYEINRLWWAFQAGQQSKDIPYLQVRELLKSLLYRNYTSKWQRQAINRILEKNEQL